MFRLVSGQKRWWEFLLTMLEREIKSKYKLSVLGVGWVLLNPVIQMLVIGFVFKFFTPLKTENYMLYLFSGLIVWNFFSSSVLRSTPAVVSERYLLKKAAFPKETMVMAIILVNFLQLLISIILMILLATLIGVKVTLANILWLPLCLLVLLLLTCGCGLILAAVNVRYRDTNFAVNFVISVWFYITPVIFTMSMLPSEVWRYLYINPLSGLVDFFRWSVFGWQTDNWNLVLVDVILSIIIFWLGIIFFKKVSLDFDDWI